MKILLMIIAAAGLMFGAFIFFKASENAIHEIEGLILVLIGTTAAVGVGVLEALAKLQAVKKPLPKDAQH